MDEEEQILINRLDRVPGYEDIPMEVSINSSKGTLKDKQDVIIYETFPALCRSALNGVTIWEKRVGTAAEISWELNLGVTEEVAQLAGLRRSAEVKPPKQSVEQKVSPRIQRITAANQATKKFRNECGVASFGFSGIVLAFGSFIAANTSGRPAEVMLWTGGIMLALILLGFYFRSWKPAACAKCHAQTIECVSLDDKFLGVRSEQKIIHNAITKQQEQRTVTVSDFRITEFWECASCKHSWQHSYVTTRG